MDTENVNWSLEEECHMNPNLNIVDVISLRDYCLSLRSSAVTYITDELIVAILHSNSYNLERAQTSATRYFELRANSPEIFQDRAVDHEDVQSGLDIVYFCPLPRKTPEGYRIILQKMRRLDLQAFQHVAAAKFEFLVLDCLCHEEPSCPGYILVYDMRGISMAHLLKSNIFLVRKLLRYTQEGSPLKIHRIAVIYASNISEKILVFMKPFMNKHMLDSIKFYSTNQMEEFWEAVPKDYWPQDYDGDLCDIETLHQSQINWLRRMQPKVDCPNT